MIEIYPGRAYHPTGQGGNVGIELGHAASSDSQ